MEYYENLSLTNIIEIIGGIVCEEEWKEIPQWEGYYMVSSFGRVKSLERKLKCLNGVRIAKGRLMAIRKDRKGYLRVMLSKDSKSKNCQVHRLVGITFLGNPFNKPRINHLKGVKHDNRVSELEWATASEDELHSYRVLGKVNSRSTLGKLGSLHHRSKKIKCTTLDIVFGSMNEAARELGISQGNLWGYINATKKNTTGLEFRYY